MPRTIQAFRGNAPKDGTPSLTLSNMKTFMTPDDPYRSAARTWKTHNRIFTEHSLPSGTRAYHQEPARRDGVLLRHATPSVLHQRHIGRVLRSSCNTRGRRLASSRSSSSESRVGDCSWEA